MTNTRPSHRLAQKIIASTLFAGLLSMNLIGCGTTAGTNPSGLSSAAGVGPGLPLPVPPDEPEKFPTLTPTPTPTRSLCGGQIQGIAAILTTEVSTLAGTAGTTGQVDDVGAAARFSEPYGVTTDGSNLFVTEKDGDDIRKIVIATGQVSTLLPPGTLREPVGITTDGTFAYVCDSVNNKIRKVKLSDGTVSDIAGGTRGVADGTGAAAQFDDPYGITIEGANLFVADRRNHTIRKIVIATGEVSTLAGSAGIFGSADGTGAAARFDEPMSITTDCKNNLYVGDWNNFTVRKIAIDTGVVTTLAGTTGIPGSTNGVGGAATLYGPRGLTSDGFNLYVADYYQRHGGKPIPAVEPPRGSSLVRKVDLATGTVTTVAGVVDSFGSADNATGTSATFNEPSGITTDGFSLFVADRQNNTVRRIR